MNYKKLFYFDIETTSEHKTFNDFVKNDTRGANNFLKRFNRRQSTSMKYETVHDAYRHNSMFFPEYGQILSLSYGFFAGDNLVVKSLINDGDEEKLMKEIQRVFDKISELKFAPCGQNIKGFDIPFIVKKLYKYNLRIPTSLQSLGKKPWEVNIVDTTELWKGMGWDTSSLDEIAHTLNLPSPKEDIDGSQVYEIFWEEHDLKRIAEYCERDVKVLPGIVKHLLDLNSK
jgi:predicted PolB exonuclease-like 3'-5' exonuclease